MTILYILNPTQYLNLTTPLLTKYLNLTTPLLTINKQQKHWNSNHYSAINFPSSKLWDSVLDSEQISLICESDQSVHRKELDQ